MATNFSKEGGVIDHTAGSAISSNDVVIMQNLIGIALTDIANGETGSVAIEGVFSLAKNSTTVIAQGELVDWDASATQIDTGITPASGDLENCGVAVAAAGNGATTVLVKLNHGSGTYTA